jgi:formylglycine-generating enzyme required for sulfatase activity
MPDDRPKPPPPPVDPGTPIGPYRVASVLSDGPSGTLYEAVETATGRRVALRHIADSVARDSTALEQFLKASGKGLRHPNLITPNGAEQHNGESYLVMEFVGGRPAGGESGRMPWRLATRIVRDAARGLAALHNAGLIHGRVAPRHALLAHDGAIRLADIGLNEGDEFMADHPIFLAPEQTQNKPAGPTADLYSLGAVYFYLLTGWPPFSDTDNPLDVFVAILERPVPTVRSGAPEIPLRCDAIIHKAMAKDPATRYQTAEALLTDLDALLADDQPKRPLSLPKLPKQKRDWQRFAVWGTSLLLLAALAGGGWYVFGPQTVQPTPTIKKPMEPPRPTVANSIGMVLVKIPDGEFRMGDPTVPDARPPHTVQLLRPFWIAATEVTQSDYLMVTGQNPSEFRGDDRPVDNVTWAEAVAFCEKLSARAGEQTAGRVYRLPTEAEWEYACRAGTTTPFGLGRTLPPEAANTARAAFQATRPVKSFAANPWGLFDMHGNVWEWCSDWYGPEYYAVSDAVDPSGPREGHLRVARGGSFDTEPNDCRCASRGKYAPETRSPAIGFRVVCEGGN